MVPALVITSYHPVRPGNRPGIGVGVLATLLAEGSDAVRRRDYDALRCLCGVAPVTRRSGKSLFVTRRLAAHNRLRDVAFHWARVAAQRDPPVPVHSGSDSRSEQILHTSSVSVRMGNLQWCSP